MEGTNAMNLDSVSYVGNEEDLVQLLEGQGETTPGKEKDDDSDDEGQNIGKGKKGKNQPPAIPGREKSVHTEDGLKDLLEDEEEEEDEKKPKKDKKLVVGDDGLNIGDEEEEEEEPEEDETTLAYLNRRAKLGLDLSKLPETFDEVADKKAVFDIMNRIVDNANKRIGQYEGIAALLEDEEVRMVLEAKKAGKTLKDIASQYVTTSDGMGDEDVVKRSFKKLYSSMSDVEITDLVEETKKKGTLGKIATAAREQDKKDKEAEVVAKTAKEQQDLAADEDARKEELQNYVSWLNKVGKVHGVTITNEIKKDAFIFSSKRDTNGQTALDRALQSDQGVFMATLGIKYLGTLLKTVGSNFSNKGKKSVLDILDDHPQSSQSNGRAKGAAKQSEDREAELFNTF